MSNYPNNEVEREVRSRVNGAMEELIRKRNSELRELAASKYAPGPGMGSGPYEQMRARVSISFYEALFQQIVDSWVDVLTRQNGKISASDVSHIVQELEARASAAPMHIRRALSSRGTTAQLLPQGAMKALEDGARQRMNELVAKHRRELQTRLYNQDHPRPGEVQPVPNINIKINSDNTDSTITSGHGNKVAMGTSKKGWWETWWGVVVTSVIAGLILWGITSYFDRREKAGGEKGKPTAAQTPAPVAAPASSGNQPVKQSETLATAEDIKVTNRAGKTGEAAEPPVSNPVDSSASPSPAVHKSPPKVSENDRREAKLQMDLAAKLTKAHNPEGALKALQEAARLNPGDVMTHKCLAVAYVSTHLDFDSAISEYELARKLPGAGPEIEDRLTSAMADKGAVQKQQHLVKESPGDADAYYELAKILSKPDMLMLGGSPMDACDKAQEAAKADATQEKILVDRCWKMETAVAQEILGSKYNDDCPVQ